MRTSRTALADKPAELHLIKQQTNTHGHTIARTAPRRHPPRAPPRARPRRSLRAPRSPGRRRGASPARNRGAAAAHALAVPWRRGGACGRRHRAEGGCAAHGDDSSHASERALNLRFQCTNVVEAPCAPLQAAIAAWVDPACCRRLKRAPRRARHRAPAAPPRSAAAPPPPPCRPRPPPRCLCPAVSRERLEQRGGAGRVDVRARDGAAEGHAQAARPTGGALAGRRGSPARRRACRFLGVRSGLRAGDRARARALARTCAVVSSFYRTSRRIRRLDQQQRLRRPPLLLPSLWPLLRRRHHTRPLPRVPRRRLLFLRRVQHKRRLRPPHLTLSLPRVLLQRHHRRSNGAPHQ